MYLLQAITAFLLVVTTTAQIQFSPTSYFSEFLEEQPEGTEVVRVGAAYFDNFGRVRTDGLFSLPSEGDAQLFTIQTSSSPAESQGIIRASVVFDRDSEGAQTEFMFTVTYTIPDGLTSSVQVNIFLADINDNTPRFPTDVFTVALLEDTPGGSSVFTVAASDPDVSLREQVVINIAENVQDIVEIYTITNGRILYSITSGNDREHFEINEETGELSLVQGVMLDIDQLDVYNLTIMAMDGGGLNDRATLIINVLDSNNNSPVISSPLGVNLTISEDTPVGYVVVDSIIATDLDQGVNAEITFLILSGDLSNSFSIDESTGRIIVSALLDRERGAVINLTVSARDGGLRQFLQDTIQVVVQLLDVNDYTPQFVQPSFTASVNEKSRAQTSVLQIQAIDLDKGPNGTVTYSILEGGEGNFIIDPLTGVISTTQVLDREETDSYSLIVEAHDNPTNDTFQLSSAVMVIVSIEDLNDNSPIFAQSSYETNILDNLQRETTVLQVFATDADSGANGRIVYEIQVSDQNNQDAFSVDATSGDVYLNHPIQFEDQVLYNFTVQALDGGAFPLTDSTLVTIIVHDVNENPPVFDQSEYNTTINETTAIHTTVLNISAQDIDDGLTGEVRYRIVTEFDGAGSFNVGELSGQIYVNSTLDFDFRDSVFFIVEAYNGGFPQQMTDRTNITIFLIGENDEAPSIIFPEGFVPSVPENEGAGIEIVILSDFTSDPDFGLGGDFAFSLVEIFDSFSQNASFELNETTGLVTSLRSNFDRELQPEGIVVAVKTIDFGSPPQSKVTNITIMIRDKNDNAPYFATNASAQVYEFMPPGIEVLRNYSALDEDIGVNAQVEYSIYSVEGFERFAIDAATGIIVTTEALNKTVQKYYNLSIIAVDQGTPPLFGFGSVFIEVLDGNDQVPVFTELIYIANVSEADPPGTLVAQVNATDADIGTNAVLNYYLDSNSNRFRINSTTGEVFTTTTFDRESESNLDIRVVAVDNGLVPLMSFATVRMFIQDINDNEPVFISSVYNSSVIENAQNGTAVVSVLATDRDSEEPNNIVRYSLSGNRSEIFSIDPISGLVKVSGEVDWELGEEFSIIIIATDEGLIQLETTAELMIYIEDVNDQAPEFSQSSLNLSIFENTPAGNDTVVGYVLAVDSDSSGNNSYVTYSIVMDFSNGRFELDSETGLVTFVKGSLNRETRALFDLLIRASDGGSPPLYTDVTLYITVLDSNEFSPVFDRDLYTGDVAEAAVLGTSVLQVRAVDIDIGSNGELRYSIPNQIDGNNFQIDEVSGIVSTSSEVFDFENADMNMYEFEVFVSDLGTPFRLNDSALVRITITDSNDHSPQFELPQYSASIRENLASGTTIFSVFATDTDTGTNAEIEYSLLGAASEYFGIDPNTGVVYTNRYINREEISAFELVITANNSASSNPLNSTVEAFINVTDLNDMHPTFDLVTYVNVYEDAIVGSVVFTLTPEDGDLGSNGVVVFSLVQETDGYFGLDQQSGDVTVLKQLDFESRKLHILTVMAIDSGNPSLSNFSNVFVNVIDVNDNAPEFFTRALSTTVSFATPVRKRVLTLQAQDSDSGSNGRLNYSIAAGNDLGLFELSSIDNSHLQTASSLRPYSGMNFSLTVKVSNPNSSLSDLASVYIYIQDGTRGLPRFTSQSYSRVLSEDATTGDMVFDFSGETVDIVTFSLEATPTLINGTIIFEIDSTLGTVTVTEAAIDFETQSLYLLTVRGQNSLGDSSYAVLSVMISDENEHPPIFVSESYFVAVPETIPTNLPFFMVTADDEDGSSPSNVVSYSITTSDTFVSSFFGINQQTGELVLRRSLDFEFGVRTFNLTVSATNAISAVHLSAETTVIVEVLNGNSFTPVFDENTYFVFLPENTTVGLNIVNVSANDLDIGSQGEITYGLHGNHRYLDFRIDTYTGQVYVNAELDYERTTYYTLQAVAADGGNPSRSAMASVLIQIEDLNDNSPVWEISVYDVTISENLTVGSFVISVFALDDDQIDRDINGMLYITNGYVTYSIAEGDPIGQFSVHPDTGIITIASSLDRELFQKYNLTLRATDGGGRFSDAYLQVTLTDVNDQIPTFTQNPYMVGVSENSPNRTFVATIQAIDTDLSLNSEITYQFSNPSSNNLDLSGTFFLNDITGEIFSVIPIDREEINLFTLVVEAIDMGATPLTGTADVQVQVLDINEFSPQFTESVFFGEVFENEPRGTSVLLVLSSDLDYNENSTILYSIVEGNSLGLFAVVANTGVIEVADSIDFEEINRIDLVIMATDSGPMESRLSNQTNVTIFVRDRNDNRPVVRDSYLALISEDSFPGEVVLFVSASDRDSGINAQVLYAINSLGNTAVEQNFDIDPQTGEIIVSNSSGLDRELTETYEFFVNATDGGTPQLHASTLVTVMITDVNDNHPQFTESVFQGSVAENLPFGTSIVSASASDADTGLNGDITYEILEFVQNQGDCLSICQSQSICNSPLTNLTLTNDTVLNINPRTGEVFTTRSLDRESVDTYVLVVQASDSPVNETRLSTSVCVLVNVLDRNDERPTFSQDFYEAGISEYAEIGEFVVQVIAEDRDILTNSEITFELVSETGNFAINPTTGMIVSLIGSYDRERQDTYNVTVLARDGGSASLTSTALVVVSILDENDSPPFFSESTFSAAIVENLPSGESVFQAVATDSDIGSNANLTYSIVTVFPQAHFEINPINGVLTTTRELDREVVDSYIVNITAIDGGSPALSASSLVNVTVLDTNDISPDFLDLPYVARIEESYSSTSQLLILVTAVDGDVGTNAAVVYSIASVSPLSNAFTINASSGEVYLVVQLDAEFSLNYSLVINASNGDARPGQSSTAVVNVLVVDLNDNAPYFEQSSYSLPLLENTPIGSSVITLQAFDDDATNQNSELRYEMSSGSNSSLFAIDYKTGVVNVTGTLDRETDPIHILEITVSDTGTLTLTAMSTLTIVLQDFNDNDPIFDQNFYNFSIFENMSPMSFVGRIQAIDLDVQNISYYLLGSGGFLVDADSGDIFTAVPLDREQQELHSFVAIATDRGSIVERTAEVVVNVTLIDLNDVTPSFLNSSYSVDVYENTTVGSILFAVEALDEDVGESSTLVYSILPSNYSRVFSINATSGEIKLEIEVDRETQDLFSILVTSRDFGDPSLTGTAAVLLRILDNNDNSPVLTETEYSTSVTENTAVSSVVLMVRATDQDIEQNADISYRLNTFDGTFVIGEKSGVIVLAQSLDYEAVQAFSFMVMAQDNGIDPRSTTSQVYIEVLDLNDNPPVFDSNVYTVSILENSILGSLVFQVPAMDADATSNSELRYSITSGNLAAVFSIDETFGLIAVSEYLDREIISLYNLGLRVVDSGSPQNTATAVLEVNVIDVNDHSPRFESETYSVSIPESLGIGIGFFTVVATDLDSGRNAELTYSIVAGNINGDFRIDPSTGMIQPSQEIDFERTRSYTLTVLVTDGGSSFQLTDTSTLYISVTDINEYPPSFPHSLFYVNVSENSVVGTQVGFFVANDQDITSHITYRLLEISPYFAVDNLEGTVYVSTALRVGEYVLTLEASDGAYVAMVMVHVTIVPLPLALTLPLFRQAAFYFEISEVANVSSVVGTFDQAGVNIVDTVFEVDVSGNLILIGQLDRETTPIYIFNAIATYSSSESPLYAVVTVRVIDENDNPPTFESPEYYVVISELTPVGTSLLTLRASDVDSPGDNTEYTIVLSSMGNIGGKFTVDPFTGELSVNDTLDYDVLSNYNLTVIATNNVASSPLTSSARVIIKLIDENDNSPIFSQPIYQVILLDSIPLGTEILTLEADDFDSGTNSELIYSITHISIPRSFAINSTTGTIETNTTFNSQQDGLTSSYVISTQVSDRGSPQPRSDTTIIFVNIIPTNAYPPLFSQPDGFSVVIAETLPVGSSIIEVSASDLDNPTEDITFDIISGDPSQKFNINPSNGVITLSKLLDYTEQIRYTLNISATDSGSPPLSSFVDVSVSLIDVNDHDPQFDQTAYELDIIENIPIGSSIVQVTATDPDAVNLTYQITVNVYKDDVPLFSINATSGEISTAAPIDREFASAPVLLVSAIDSGYPIQRSNSVPVTVVVRDVNDNAPVFRQQNYTIPVVRLLGPGQYVAMVTADDADFIGEPLTYVISQDSSNGLFKINSSSGRIISVSEIPEAVSVGFNFTVSVTDGLFETAVLVEILLVDNGEYCSSADFCVRVREVNCTFDIYPFVECNPFCLGEFELSPDRRVCISHHCLNSELGPCVAMETCLPMNQACAGVCPEGMSVCPTTGLCHVVSLTESCDLSNETCLTGQTLVQREDSSRYCTLSVNLPVSGQNCTNGGLIFCETLNECQNITKPFLCQACPGNLQLCVDTEECVTDLLQCCGASGRYCDVLNSCLSIGVRCELPNVAPTIDSSLIYLETFEYFQARVSDQGHVISLLLGNMTHPAVDSQGEEVGIAIVQASDILQSNGEWQYALCADSPTDSNGSCSDILSSWITIDTNILSEINALVLPNSARVRFVRKVIELDGAVWLRVKLWDGNSDGFISPSKDLANTHIPTMETTLPFSSNGAYSKNTTLLVIVILPLITPPFFSSDASLQLSSITEDVVFASNLGNNVIDIVRSVYVPDYMVLAEDRIEGLEGLIAPNIQLFEQLLPVSVRDLYYESVQLVNPTRKERRLALDSGQFPGASVYLNSNPRGTWQVSLTGDPRQFISLNSVLQSPGEIILINTTARLRFLPALHFCGVDFLSVCPWDGYWNRSATQFRENSFIVLSDIELPLTHSSSRVISSYNLNDCEMVKIEVVCSPDKPVLLANQAFLDPIPHRLIHSYTHVFTALIEETSLVVRAKKENFEEFLQITLQQPVDIKRISPALANRTYVSFSVQGDTYTFNEVNSRIQDRHNTLSDLGFPVVSFSQDSSYGSGAGCQGDEPQPYNGVHVNTFISQYTLDRDNNFVGMAVIAMDTTAQNFGVWQYHRGNWSSNENQSQEYDPLSNIWINFPPRGSVTLSDTRALLLHGNDRLRFIPHPDVYWGGSSNSPVPSVSVKIWDNSDHIPLPKHELATMNINTNPMEDTVQSLLYPQGMFSDGILTITAARVGCDGVINSEAVYDACCECGGRGDLCRGCDSVMASNNVYGACDVCSEPLGLDSCFGCDFIPFSGMEPGQCSECTSKNSVPDLDSSEQYSLRNFSFLDCNGQCFGAGLLDACLVCSGGDTAHYPNMDIDCAGNCFGGAIIDSCRECTGPGTLLSFDQSKDCTGVCHGPFVSDSCDLCQLADETGNVRENRDCAGVCFGEATTDGCGQCAGGTTNLTAGYSLDVCGVCDGDNTTCVGCDGIGNSGLTIDSCGECGGNGCGCFKLDTLTPDRGPRTGGTDVLLHGAGFFLNNSISLGFQFDESSPNCGAPFVFPDTGASVRITCLFVAANQQLQARAFPINQSTIRCTTEPTDAFDVYIRQFDVRVRIDSGPFSNAIPFFYDDYSSIVVNDIVPFEREVNVGGEVVFRGENFLNTSFLSCLIYDFAQCVFPSGAAELQAPLFIPATFTSSSVVSCLLPVAYVPCQVTIRVTLDGQESGIINSLLTSFTYRHSAPTVESVHFSTDLSSLVIQFEQQAETTVPSISCVNVFHSDTFDLIGGMDADCLWADNSQRQLHISLPQTATVKVTSPIRFMDGVLVTRHQQYSFGISNMTFTVNSEPNAVHPVAVVNGPRFVPPCGNLTFSGIDSQYPGYGGLEFHWTVHVNDSSVEGYTQLVNQLDSFGIDSPIITLTSDLFQFNVEYYLQLYVVNSIGLQSEIESIVLHKEIEPRPSLVILGTQTKELKPGEDLIVQSVLTPSQCVDALQVEYSYTWTLRKIVDQRRNLFSAVDLSSVRTQSPEIVIPSSFFEHGSNYVLSLDVAAAGQTIPSQAVLNVVVLPVSLLALINGGNRTVSQSREIVLDARNSSQNSLLPSASFVWSCRVVGSLEACYNYTLTGQPPVPIFLSALDYLTFPASDLMPERMYIFTVQILQGEDISMTNVAVRVVSARPPIVEINNPDFIVRSTESLYLEGLVYSSVPVETVYWESLALLGQGTIDLSNKSIIQSQTSYLSSQDVTQTTSVVDYLALPLRASITTNSTSRAPLVISANSLTPGLTYTFRLTAVSREGTSFSQVTIVPSSPPLSSRLVAIPSSGDALETEFVFDVVDTVDDTVDSPFLYVFGIVEDSSIALTATAVPDHVITWISGVQTSNRLRAVLPSGRGNMNYTLVVLARVFNRNHDKSDHMTSVTVQPDTALTQPDFSALLNDIKSKFASTKNWNDALSDIVATLLELNKTTDVTIKEQILQLFVDIFENYLPPSLAHYQVSTSILKLVSENGIGSPESQFKISATLNAILQWYDREASLKQLSVAVPNQSEGEPLFLQSTYKQDASSLLSESMAMNLLAPLDNLLNTEPSQTQLAKTYVESVDLLTTILCKESYPGGDPTEYSTSRSSIYTLLTKPKGAFNVSGVLVNFKESVMDVFQTQACVGENVPCVETCFSGVLYSYDLLDNRSTETSGPQLLQLKGEVQDILLSEIDGSDPQSVELFSDVMSVSVQIPSRNEFLRISNLDAPIQVLFPKNSVVPDHSQPLCLYREVGGGRGSENNQWLLDSLAPPQTQVLSGNEYLVCEFNHLTEFAIGVLPPPVITTETPPPTTTQLVTTTETTTEPTTMTTMATTEPTTIPPEPQSPAAAIAIVIILILIIVTILLVLLVVFLVWKKKHSKKLRIVPDVDETDGQDESIHLTKAGPLTPEESKVPMQIILCSENDERKLVGQLNVLPSIRLRELRVQLADNFAMFKNKPFYFLTRQLCDIEPAAEQQQFVSLVFGDKPIFVREVTAQNDLTKKHFCVCGNAAQFECSNCSSQGYCSPECQHRHWDEQHQKQCSKLSERRRRSSFLTGRPGNLSLEPATSVVASGNFRRVTVANISSTQALPATSPTSPGDWKSFINAGKKFSEANVVLPVNTRMSLSELAAEQPSQPQGGPRTPASLSPLQRVPSVGVGSSLSTKRSLPSLSRNISLQYPVAQSQTPSQSLFQEPPSNIRARTSLHVYGSASQGLPTPLQSPLRTQPDLFTRLDPQQGIHNPPLFSRNLSIQSVGSEDFGFSMNMSRDVRNEPLLESDEEDYESSTTNGSVSQSPSPAPVTSIKEAHTSSVTPATKDLKETDVKPVATAIDRPQSSSSRPTSGKSVSSGKLQSENDSSHKKQEGQSLGDIQPLPDTSKLLEAVPSSAHEQ